MSSELYFLYLYLYFHGTENWIANQVSLFDSLLKILEPHLGFTCWQGCKLGALPVTQMIKSLPVIGRPRFDPWIGKIPCRRKWQPTPVFLPGESHGQRSLVGDSCCSVTKSCPTLSNPMDYRLPGSSIQGIFQAKVLEWGAIAFSAIFPRMPYFLL